MTKTPARNPAAVRAIRILSKASWALASMLVVLFVALGVAQASHLLTLEKILTGSMEPTIMTGDYVVTRAPNGHDLHRGTILTYENPAAYNGLSITHRVHAVSDGRALMMGDNNPATDPYRIAESDVRGVVVGHIGRVGAHIIALFIPVPQWFVALRSLIGGGSALLPEVLRDAPWGLAAVLLMLALAEALSRLILRPHRRA